MSISAPSVIAINTQEAKIEAGSRLPLPTPPNFDTNEREQKAEVFVATDISLEVTPTIKQGQTYFSAPVKDGSTLLLNCRQDKRRKGSLLIALTASGKDETGHDMALK